MLADECAGCVGGDEAQGFGAEGDHGLRTGCERIDGGVWRGVHAACGGVKLEAGVAR